MCVACYGMAGAPGAPVASAGWHPSGYQQWTCYPTQQMVCNPPAYYPTNQYTCYPTGQAGGYLAPPIKVRDESPAPAPPAKKSKTTNKGPKLINGAVLIHPTKHADVYLIRDVKLWVPGAKGHDFKFKIHRVPVTMSVAEYGAIIVTGGDLKGWVLTEAIELGDGCWSKGTNIKLDSDKAKNSMASFGWNEKCGAEMGRAPVWLVLHKG